MNKIVSILVSVFIVLFSTSVCTVDYHAENYSAYIDLLDKSFPDSAGLVSSIADSLSAGGWSQLAKDLINGRGAYNVQVIKVSVDNGYMLEYVDEFKACGKLDTNWEPASSKSSDKNSGSQPKAKTEFSVEDVTPYKAWVTKNCNIRSGADTTYDKVGSLKKNEEVTVTGKASTGWFRITTSSGVEAYISNSLLTTDDPKSVTFKSVEENGDIVTTTVEGENAEAVAKVVEEIQAEEAADEPEPVYTSKVTKEATCTETGVITYTSENGDSYTEEIPMLEHTPGEWEITKKATPFSKGEKVQKCTQCGEALATEDIPQNMIALYIIIGAIIATLSAIGIIVCRKQHG